MDVSVYLASLLVRPEPTVETVGSLELAPHQARAVAALVHSVRYFGGGLLADAVGLGKTRVCLAAAERLARLAREDGERGPIWLVVPARLVETWRERATLAGFREDQVEYVTHAAMSRRRLPERAPSVVVVDEAHHFRNRRAKRYRTLAEIAEEASLLLATATPVANRLDDLRALLQLFLGEADLRPWTGSDLSEAFETTGPTLTRLLTRVVVRRTRWDGGKLRRPRTRLELLHYDPDDAEAWVWSNLGNALAELRLTLLEGDWPAGLFVEHALRLWESGPRALGESLRKLVDFHERWLEADAIGASISRVGFQDLFEHQPDQSVLPFMFGEVEEFDAVLGRDAVLADLDRLRELTRRIEAASRDVARERALVELLRREPGKMLVFTSFRLAARSTFDAIVEGMGREARVGLVTGDGALATGLGRCSMHEVIRRFSPGAFDLELPDHQVLDVLVATDCIAEGVDLHDCGRIVLADLPYSPLRIEQRIGRLLRPGSPHEEVVVHLPRPRNWNDSLGMRRRISRKLAHANAASVPYDSIVDPVGENAGQEAEERKAHGLNPLSALTRRDAWLRSLPEPAAHTPPAFARLESNSENALWLFATLSDGVATEDLVVRVGADETVDESWQSLLRYVDELSRDGVELRPAESVRPRLQALADAALEAHVDRLNAARLAPFPIDMNSVPARAHAAINAWSANHDIEVDPDALRERLLRPWPRGIERRIESWIESPWRGARAWRELPRHPASRRVEIVARHLLDVGPANSFEGDVS